MVCRRKKFPVAQIVAVLRAPSGKEGESWREMGKTLCGALTFPLKSKPSVHPPPPGTPPTDNHSAAPRPDGRLSFGQARV